MSGAIPPAFTYAPVAPYTRIVVDKAGRVFSDCWSDLYDAVFDTLDTGSNIDRTFEGLVDGRGFMIYSYCYDRMLAVQAVFAQFERIALLPTSPPTMVLEVAAEEIEARHTWPRGVE